MMAPPQMICSACQAPNDAAAGSCIACGQPLVAEPASPKPGAVFAGRYQILSVLGRGGMGMVYKAHDVRLDETIALKVIRPDLARESRLHDRFRSEIKLARRIRHKNVCSIYGDGEEQGILWVCMELVEGVDLRQLVRERSGLPPHEAFLAAIQIAEGLAAIHEVGIIHRDLKTANVMRDERGVVRLMDFGLAKQWRAEDSGGLTANGHVVGTPDYMSPEQARGEKLTFASDLYALGVITFELFTGEPPFRGDTPLTTLLKHLHDPPPLEDAAGRRLPPALVPVLRRALAKAPRERFASAAEMAEALREARDAGADEASATPLRLPRLADRTPTLDGAAPTKRDDVTEDMPRATAGSVPATSGRSASWNAPLSARRWGAGWFLVPMGVVAMAVSSALLLVRSRSPQPTPAAALEVIEGPPSTAPERTLPAPPMAMAVPPATMAAARPILESPGPPGLGISHEPIGCLVAREFPLIEATIVHPAAAGKGRVFFKSSLGDAYYFVDMIRDGGSLVGKLPKPKVEASPIRYYIVTYAGGSPRWAESGRTPEHSAVVATSRGACPPGIRSAAIGPPGAISVFSALPGRGDLVFSLKDAFGLEDLIAALKDPEARVRERAAASLGQLGPAASQAIGAALKELRSPDPVIRAGAASDLGETGQRLLRQVTIGLVAALKDRDAAVRLAATQALGEIGPGFAAAVAALREGLRDPDARVRTAAADALGSMGSVLASALAALEDASSNETDKRVEKAADAALGRIRSQR